MFGFFVLNYLGLVTFGSYLDFSRGMFSSLACINRPLIAVKSMLYILYYQEQICFERNGRAQGPLQKQSPNDMLQGSLSAALTDKTVSFP